MNTNKDKVVMQSVIGEVSSARSRGTFSVDRYGNPIALPGVGGITYNVKIGDSVFGLAGDHIEPGVSAKNTDAALNKAFVFYSCVGNEAKVVSGDAKGKKGTVIGGHGGIDHVIIHFDDETNEQLVIGDKIQIKGYGEGFALNEELSDVYISKLDPRLFEKLVTNKDGKIEVPVTTIVPGDIMGSGIGDTFAHAGDYDITTGDKDIIEKYGIDKLKFGDFVCIENHFNKFGREYRAGSKTIGIVIHSDCLLSGHGPGVTTLITTLSDKIKPIIDENANIKNYI